MRLVRVEAGRFGKIDGRSLGDLAPGLTVVHGPNEAGKSSLTALVRHVLYGFPTRGDAKEAPYLSDAGAREGRLFFADDAGEWVVERREGVHGGPVTVRTLSGSPRDGLVGELTSGVSRLAYRVVFGFGLADMHQIEELKGKDDDLLARLYAAGAGLTVSPIDVRSALDASKDALWAKRATTAALNRDKARRDELRTTIRELEAETDRLRQDASHLEELDTDLEAAKMRRAETLRRAQQAALALADATRLLDETAALQDEAAALELAAADLASDAERMVTDDAALAAVDAVEALVAGLSGFAENVAAHAAHESRLAAAEARMRAALADSGWTEEAARAAAIDAGVGAQIDTARDALAKIRGREEAAAEARERLRAEGGAAAAGAPGRPWLVPGAAVAILGALGVAAGLIVNQMPLAAFAGVLLVAGLVLAALRSGGGASHTAGGTAARLAVAEGEWQAAHDALTARMAEWSAWVVAHGLGDGSEEPVAIAARYQAARSARAADLDRDVIAADVARERERVDAFVARIRTAVAPLLAEAPEAVTADRAAELVNRAAARVDAARAGATLRAETLSRGEGLARQAWERRERATRASEAAAVALTSLGEGVDDLGTARLVESDLRALADQAADEFDRLSTECTALRTALGAERRESALAELRLEEETIGERIADGVAEYAVLALASQLMSRAQERYERDRQPEVVKRAQDAFARMTNGRYPRVAIPLGRDAIEVFDAASAATVPGRLSRGTAEQLYLALRLGLIEQMGEVGRGLPILMDDILVDFSPDRLEPAVRAIADLATRRQVVFLTCHPATADLLCAAAPDAVRLELARPI